MTGPCVALDHGACEVVRRINRLFFLNEGQGLSHVQVADMGILKYPPYKVHVLILSIVSLNLSDIILCQSYGASISCPAHDLQAARRLWHYLEMLAAASSRLFQVHGELVQSSWLVMPDILMTNDNIHGCVAESHACCTVRPHRLLGMKAERLHRASSGATDESGLKSFVLEFAKSFPIREGGAGTAADQLAADMLQVLLHVLLVIADWLNVGAGVEDKASLPRPSGPGCI